MFKLILNWVVARGTEASSYAGLAGVLGALHIANAAALATPIESICMGVAGLIAILVPEA